MPGTVVEVMAGYIVVVLLLPLSVGKTLMRRTFFFVGDEAMTERFEDNREGLKRFWQKIATQDQTLLERVHNQQFLRAEVGVHTRFSAYWETAVHRFQKLVVERLR